MSEYVTVNLNFSERDREIYQKLIRICIDCEKQTEGRVCRNYKITLIKDNLTESVGRIRKQSGAKKFLDEVCCGNCGELVVQYVSSDEVKDYTTSSVIIKKRDGNFLAIVNDTISNLQSYYRITSDRYERAKKNAGFFQSMKLAALGSNVREFGGESFDERARKILKIILDAKTVDEKLRSVEEYFYFARSQHTHLKHGNFYDINQADQFIRDNTTPLYLETAPGYNLPSISVPLMQVSVTFKYNETFYQQIKTFINSGFVKNRQECLEVLKRLDSSPDRSVSRPIATSSTQDDPEVQKAFSLVEKDLFNALSSGVNNIIEDFKEILKISAAARDEKNISDSLKGIQVVRNMMKEVRKTLKVSEVADLNITSNLSEEIYIGLREAGKLKEDINLFKSSFVEMTSFADRQGKILLIKDTCNLLQPVSGAITGILGVTRAIKENLV